MNVQTRNQAKNKEQSNNSEINRKSLENQKNRKRVRLPEFDLNRSSIHTEPKQRRVYRVGKYNMENMNSGESLGSQFVDLSGTINNVNRDNSTSNQASGSGFRASSLPTNDTTENLGPGVREIVADEALVVQRSLEDKIRRMVQDEMSDIKKTIGDLAKAVQGLTRSASTDTNNVAANQRNSSENILSVPVTNNTNDNRYNTLMFNRNETSNTYPMINDNCTTNLPTSSVTPSYSARKENRTTPSMNEPFDFRQIRIDKLGVVFDNKSMSIDDFIFRLEHLKTHYNISDREVVRDFHLLVSDSVKDWYWSFIGTHGLTEWPVLRLALIAQYQTPCSNFEIMRDLVERKQQQNETIDMFFLAMNKLRSKLTQPMPEYDMIRIMKRNVNSNLARIIYPLSVSSVEQLRIECNEAERNFPRRETRNLQPLPRVNRQVNELYFEEKSDTVSQVYTDPELVEVEALRDVQQQQQQKQTLICWNCRISGHVFMECPVEQRSLFCYKCGKPNVTTPKCPICQQKNITTGVGRTGNSRQKENPVVSIE